MIEVYYLIYYRQNMKRQYENIIPRSGWDFKNKKVKIPLKNLPFRIPYFHIETLANFFDRFYDTKKHLIREEIVEFTLGFEEQEDSTELSAIAIKHPRDNFNKKIGRKIVEGRIKRMKGEIEGREPYDLEIYYLVYKEE